MLNQSMIRITGQFSDLCEFLYFGAVEVHIDILTLTLEWIQFQIIFTMILLWVTNKKYHGFFFSRWVEGQKALKVVCFWWRWILFPRLFLAELQWLSQLVLQVAQRTLGGIKFWEEENVAVWWTCYYLSTPLMFSGTRPSMTARFDSKICNAKANLKPEMNLKQSANIWLYK